MYQDHQNQASHKNLTIYCSTPAVAPLYMESDHPDRVISINRSLGTFSMNITARSASAPGTSVSSDHPAIWPGTLTPGPGCPSRIKTGPLLCDNRWRPTIIENVNACAHRITVRWDLRQNRHS